MAPVLKQRTLKHMVPDAAQRALLDSNLGGAKFDLTMHLIHSDPQLTHLEDGGEEGYYGLLIVGQESVQATRTSFLTINLFSVASAVIALTRAPSDPASYVAFLVAFAAALTGKLTKEQAAFFVASKLLMQEGRAVTIASLSSKIGALIYRPTYSEADTNKLIASLNAQGIEVLVGPAPSSVVSYEERALFLPI